MGTNCAPLLADLFLYYYEADFIQELLKKKDKKLAISFNFTFRYIDEVLSLNNTKFGDYVERIYPIELEIKDATDTMKSASYLDLHLEIEYEGRLKTNLYDKRDDFSFPIVNFLLYFLSGFLGWRIAADKEAIKRRVPNGEVEIPLFFLRTPSRVGGPLWNSRFTDDIGYVPYVVTTIPFPFHMTYRIRLFTGATCRAGSAYPSGAPDIIQVFGWVRVA